MLHHGYHITLLRGCRVPHEFTAWLTPNSLESMRKWLSADPEYAQIANERSGRSAFVRVRPISGLNLHPPAGKIATEQLGVLSPGVWSALCPEGGAASDAKSLFILHACTVQPTASTAASIVLESDHPVLLQSVRLARLAGLMLEGAPVGPGSSISLDWFGGCHCVRVRSTNPSSSTHSSSTHSPSTHSSSIHTSSSIPFSFPSPVLVAPTTQVRFERPLPPQTPRVDAASWIRRVEAFMPGFSNSIQCVVTAICSTLHGDTPRGSRCFLFTGASGAGKTALATAIARFSNMPHESVSAQALMRVREGETEACIAALFTRMASISPAILVIDDIDALVASRDAAQDAPAARANSTFCRILSELNDPGMPGILPGIAKALGVKRHPLVATDVFVFATASRREYLTKSLTAAGRLDREIHLSAPGAPQRLSMLQHLSTSIPVETKKGFPADAKEKLKILREIAEKAHGLLPADLRLVCQRASMLALNRTKLMGKSLSATPCRASLNDFLSALARTRPARIARSGFRGLSTSNDGGLATLGGLETIIQQLHALVIDPFRNAQLYAKAGVRPPKGVLIYGPPGTGKTTLAVEIARKSGINVVRLDGPEVVSRVVGQSEKSIEKAFWQARAAAPSIILIDQIEVFATRRDDGTHGSDRLLSTLLTEMDGVRTGTGTTTQTETKTKTETETKIGTETETKTGTKTGTDSTTTESRTNSREESVIVLATTACINQLDPAILRPGRFDQRIAVPPPSERARADILRKATSQMPLGVGLDLGVLATLTKGFSGADLVGLCREAAMESLRENMRESMGKGRVEMRHFERAMTTTRPSLKSTV